MLRMISTYHIQPQESNDAFSEKVMNRLIRRIDPIGLLFLEEEVKDLRGFSSRLDDEWETENCGFIRLLQESYSKAINRAERIIQNLLETPFNYNEKESIQFYTSENQFGKDENELKIKWKRFLKLEILDILFIRDPESGKIPTVAEALKNEKDARQKVKKKEAKRIARKKEYPGGIENYVMEIYLDCIATAFDPHTQFFSERINNQFKESLSSETLSFGIDWTEAKDGNPEVAEMNPGGPAWNSGEINIGDQVIFVEWQDGTTTSSNDLDVEDFIRKSELATTTKITLTFQKSDGQVRKVSLQKEKMRSEENIISGFILEEKKRIGYITLPAFYTQWETINPKGCAQDVAREIIKMKQENIEGLIIDLRFNGGGSMYEALQLAGIFIDEGALGIQKYSQTKPQIFKDPNRGTVYTGPLLILVNRHSASASEVFAAAMQDYNRAIIAGTTTYGKATGQAVIPLDTTAQTKKNTVNVGPADFVKITMLALYRCTAKTHQARGIVPDIEIPDISNYSSGGESEEETHLKLDSVDKKSYFKPFPSKDYTALREKSQQRLASDSLMIWLKKHEKAIIQYYNENQVIDLDINTYYSNSNLERKIFEDYYRITGIPSEEIRFYLHAYDRDLISIDSFRKSIFENQMENLKMDRQLREAFYILSDYIQSQ
ncbi:MAG TPA: carboxy terminal-processing peptidase [Flavobacteriales bacterium]|nr:carboxy terminal-processing peptidase [Flavobacteriales bacterium]HRJ35849.1 carboxy terminal-processing peptidase [Flavobacteriales bacterium]HRJ38125.1 carboxy terminal-processing peptidase [Flavobacteriales bacterium]